MEECQLCGVFSDLAYCDKAEKFICVECYNEHYDSDYVPSTDESSDDEVDIITDTPPR